MSDALLNAARMRGSSGSAGSATATARAAVPTMAARSAGSPCS
ncbi:hypothetical protein [Dactylosporangium sp. NPDC050588]